MNIFSGTDAVPHPAFSADAAECASCRCPDAPSRRFFSEDYGGIIVVNKSAGMTSAGVVSQLRRFLGLKRVGHTGTLDPFATGVLPVCFGRATAAAHYMLGWTKRYRCSAVLGAATDTMDRDGRVTERAEKDVLWQRFLPENMSQAPDTGLPALSELCAAVSSLSDITLQQAPAYSAVKRDGKPLYAYARSGLDVERPVRRITVFASELAGVEQGADGRPRVAIECLVSSGTYIRALVDTLGRKLRCYAYAEALERLSSGPFDLRMSVGADSLSDRFEACGKDSRRFRASLMSDGIILAAGSAFSGWRKAMLSADDAAAIVHGRRIPEERAVWLEPDAEAASAAPPPEARDAALFCGTTLIAAASLENGVLIPKRVFAACPPRTSGGAGGFDAETAPSGRSNAE